MLSRIHNWGRKRQRKESQPSSFHPNNVMARIAIKPLPRKAMASLRLEFLRWICQTQHTHPKRQRPPSKAQFTHWRAQDISLLGPVAEHWSHTSHCLHTAPGNPWKMRVVGPLLSFSKVKYLIKLLWESFPVQCCAERLVVLPRAMVTRYSKNLHMKLNTQALLALLCAVFLA